VAAEVKAKRILEEELRLLGWSEGELRQRRKGAMDRRFGSRGESEDSDREANPKGNHHELEMRISPILTNGQKPASVSLLALDS